MKLNFVRASQLCDNLGLRFKCVRGFKFYREVYDLLSNLLLFFGFGNVQTFIGQLFSNI